MQASDPQTELLNAVSWLTARMHCEGSAVLVVPDLAGREAEVSQILDRAVGRLGWYQLAGQPAGRKPMIAAAASALRLFSEGATFATLSRWLRSPFFVCEDGAVRAGIERALRDSVAAQLPFRDAYGRAGLRSQLRSRSARLGRAVDKAFRLIAEHGPRQAPTRWTQIWSQLLETLGWCGSLPDTEPDVVAGWEEALGAFAELTPILGSLGWSRACDEFTALLERPVWQGPVPQTTLYLAETLEELGPGHVAVWMTGATDRRWPRLRPMSPFVPLWFAAQQGPASKTTLEQSHREFDQLRTAGREIVLSWPRREADIPCSPSPLLEGLPQVTPEALIPTSKSSCAPLAELEIVADPAPPFLAERIPGGTRALALQSSCPARAFCELRLGARALPLLERGTSRARWGTMLHAAVQILLRRLPTQEALAGDPQVVEAAIEDSVAAVLNRTLGSVRSVLPSLYEIEELLLTATLGALVRFELEREPFEVEALESEAEFQALGRVVALRPDRIDCLSDGRRVVIDYKTGGAPRAIEWLAQPPLEPQLPLYALALWPDVSAVAALLLQPDRIQATGFWPAEAFPMRSVKSAEGLDWPAQIERWRQGVESLIREFVGGDTRVYSHRRVEAGAELAAITRVLELPPASEVPIDE